MVLVIGNLYDGNIMFISWSYYIGNIVAYEKHSHMCFRYGMRVAYHEH